MIKYIKGENMADEEIIERRSHFRRNSYGGDAVYAIGLVGALVYYIEQADTFWFGVLGVLKALVWPAMVVYHLLSLLQL